MLESVYISLGRDLASSGAASRVAGFLVKSPGASEVRPRQTLVTSHSYQPNSSRVIRTTNHIPTTYPGFNIGTYVIFPRK